MANITIDLPLVGIYKNTSKRGRIGLIFILIYTVTVQFSRVYYFIFLPFRSCFFRHRLLHGHSVFKMLFFFQQQLEPVR